MQQEINVQQTTSNFNDVVDSYVEGR